MAVTTLYPDSSVYPSSTLFPGANDTAPLDGGSADASSDATGQGWLIVEGSGAASGDSNATGSGNPAIDSGIVEASLQVFAFGDGTVIDPSTIVTFTTLTGTFMDDLGDRITGSVILTPEVRFRLDRVHKRIISLQPRMIALINGKFSAVVPSNGQFWRWRCELVREDTARRDAFYFVVPVGTDHIDIADCVGIKPSDDGPVTAGGLGIGPLGSASLGGY